MSNPFDLISPELGPVRGLPTFISDVHAHYSSAVSISTRAIGIPQLVQPGCKQLNPSEYLDKIERRRKRERESARRSRARKQSRMVGLEGRNAILEQDNQQLHEQLRTMNISELIRERNDLFLKLQTALDLIGTSDDESALTPLIEEYHSTTELIFQTQIRSMEAILASVNQVNLATAILLILLATEQDSASNNSLLSWGDLIQELELSSEQSDSIAVLKREHQKQFNSIIEGRKNFVALVEKLKQTNGAGIPSPDSSKSFREMLNKTLTKTQQAKMMVWLHRKQDLLDQL